MSIKTSQIVFSSDPDFQFLPNGEAASEEDTLALIRHILRERSDCSIIPVVNGVIKTREVNEYGHNLFIDVTYSKNGWRATYAGSLTDSGVTNVQCYMD